MSLVFNFKDKQEVNMEKLTKGKQEVTLEKLSEDKLEVTIGKLTTDTLENDQMHARSKAKENCKYRVLWLKS